MRTVFTAFRAVIFMTGFVALWGWIALGLRRYDPALGGALPGWTALAGIVLMALGGLVALACGAVFVIHGQGTPAPFDPPRRFVAIGPYRYVRNPMYIGGWIVLAGFGCIERSPSILIFSLPWLLLAHLFVILYEEPALRSKFGASYEHYCSRVSRWIPSATDAG
jgi:protein-S-isoprenylcysteine O-methyltransferase Ste14